MCGEHPWAPGTYPSKTGSPPHVRGTRRCRESRRCPQRITPACAGNTNGIGRHKAPTQDHPRMCGEHSLRMIAIHVFMGSPPHVRGTRLSREDKQVVDRITPACAGNTLTLTACRCLIKDHPRMCGEHYSSMRLPTSLSGITPACAGNTRYQPQTLAAFEDHPRMCGEHCVR